MWRFFQRSVLVKYVSKNIFGGFKVSQAGFHESVVVGFPAMKWNVAEFLKRKRARKPRHAVLFFVNLHVAKSAEIKHILPYTNPAILGFERAARMSNSQELVTHR